MGLVYQMVKWSFLAILGLNGWQILAFQVSNGLTPSDIAQIKSVSQAVISPDGETIAVVLNIPREIGVDSDGPAWRELHVIHRKTGVQRPFITGQERVGNIAWVPDGSGIAFIAKRADDEAASLYIIPIDGGEARCGLSMANEIKSYSFSPDGKKVAIIAERPTEKSLKKQKDMGFTQSVVEEDWQATGLFLAEPFASGEPQELALPGSAIELAWSPSGDKLAVALAPTPLVDARYTEQNIHILDVKTGSITQKVPHAGKLGAMAWRPDGQMLAFIGALDRHDPSAGRLWLYHLADGNLSDPLNNHEGQIRALAWQSNKHVMFIDHTGVWSRFAKIATDGSDYKQIVKPGGPILTALSLSKDGQNAAFIANAPNHASEIYTMSHGDPTPQRRTHLNPWLKDRRLATQAVVQFKARDGLDLEGILIRPLDWKSGQPVPLVLYVHGGPEAHHSNGWLTSYSSPGQVAAARGMAVFHTNYRGSTGRGVAFSKLSQSDPAGKEFDDLVDAVDHLVSSGLVNTQKVGITGGSYGGYATAWAATYYSHRFAVGVMFVGITNTISKFGTTDIAEEEFLVHALNRPWDDWQGYLERSPIYHGDKHKTPLLILHGADDPRVNVGQSRELYRHLKIRGQAPVRLVTYPGEGHGNRRAASRLDYHLRAIRWLEHYLLGPGGDPPAHPVNYNFE